MDLDRYETEARIHCGELLEEMRSFGIERLHEACCTAGTEAATTYLQKTCIASLEYLRATPSRRKTLLRKVPEPEQALFLVCAAYRARCALALLEAVCQYGVTAGPSYRMITAQAAAAADDIHLGRPTLWPFEDDDGLQDPFDGL